MGTTEEQISYLTQQLHTMRTDVAELQNALRGSATGYADLVVRLVTTEPRERRVTEAGDEATAVMSRLQALETRSTGAMTSVAQDVQEHGSDRIQAARVEWREELRLVHSILGGIAELGRARDGRLMELDVSNAGTSQETVENF